jgi:hypothetical protein
MGVEMWEGMVGGNYMEEGYTILKQRHDFLSGGDSLHTRRLLGADVGLHMGRCCASALFLLLLPRYGQGVSYGVLVHSIWVRFEDKPAWSERVYMGAWMGCLDF